MAEKTVQYLRLIGRLSPDNRLALRPGYLSDAPRYDEGDESSPLVAELSDAEGKLLLRHRVPARPYCVNGQYSSQLAVRADLPFAEGTRAVRFYRDDVLLQEIVVAKAAPELRLSWTPPEKASGKQEIAWEGSHPEQRPLQYFLRYSQDDGRTWRRLGLRTEKTSKQVDFDALPGGKRCRLAVVATDGVNTASAQSDAFPVPVKPCVAMIQAPKEGAKVTAGRPFMLHGQGFWLEENEPELADLAWSSDKDGQLGRGRYVKLSELSPGSHKISLAAGEGKRAGRADVTIHVL